jgi:hypothetical protein
MIGFVFRGFKGDRASNRNRQHDRALFRASEEPPQDGAKVRDLLFHADAFRLAAWSVAATSLFPVPHKEIPLEFEQPLKFPNLVQQGQAWASLNDQQGRPSFAFGAEMDPLARAVNLEIDRSVNFVSCRGRHSD